MAVPLPRAAWVLSAIVALLMVAASAAGLWVHGLYHDALWASTAYRGGDLVTLVVAAPAQTAALLLSRRGSRRAQLVWVGILAYSVYNYAFCVFGSVFNDVFLLHVALFSLSVFALALTLANPGRGEDRRRVRQAHAGTLDQRLSAAGRGRPRRDVDLLLAAVRRHR